MDKRIARRYRGEWVILQVKVFDGTSDRKHRGKVVLIGDDFLDLETKQGNKHRYHYYKIASLVIDKKNRYWDS